MNEVITSLWLKIKAENKMRDDAKKAGEEMADKANSMPRQRPQMADKAKNVKPPTRPTKFQCGGCLNVSQNQLAADGRY